MWYCETEGFGCRSYPYSAIAGMLGTIQASETLKYLTGVGELLTNRLLSFNAKTMEFRTVRVRQSDKCPVCGLHPTVTELVDYEQATCELRGSNV